MILMTQLTAQLRITNNKTAKTRGLSLIHDTTIGMLF